MTEFKGIIYKTTNLVNNKFYVGQDLHNKPKYLGSGLLLRKAIRKYGLSMFIKEILEQCESVEHLNEREKFWILTLDARNHNIAYNIGEGGHFGDVLSTHPRKKEIFDNVHKTKSIIGLDGLTTYSRIGKNKQKAKRNCRNLD